MAKIIKIEDDKILIGTDNGEIKEVRKEDVSFNPTVNQEVDIFESSDSIIVTKKEKKEENNIPGGININLQNNQSVPAGQLYVAQNKKVVNKVVYCLLALFLGGIGIHKMYAGKVGTGILYLLFCWTCIPAFIAFIDLIVAICQKADANGNILQ